MNGWTEGKLDLEEGPIHYREAGSGRPLVFVHGALVNSRLWDDAAVLLADRFRCILPDLPLGSHPEPMDPGADISPRGIASIVGKVRRELGADDAILVGNDTGGALCQLLVTSEPEGFAGLVLTNCDMYDKFPPGFFGPMFRAARNPAVLWLITQTMRAPFNRPSPLAYGMLTKRRLPNELLADWVRPGIDSAEIRRDFRKVLRGVDPALTIEAAEKMPGFDKPVLFAWAPEDKLFKVEFAERMAPTLPDARIVRIPDARTFVMLDQPQRVADEIAEFADAVS
jgi:pimeloyl-ACP methyl ester carboxylesterase